MKGNSIAENTRLAQKIVAPIIKILDKNVDAFDIEKCKATVERMEADARHVGAFPAGETINRG